MALSAKVSRTFIGEQDEISTVLSDTDTYYAGGLIAAVSGKGDIPADVAENQPILGVLTGEYSDGERTDAKVIGSSNTIRATLKRGKVWLPHTGAAITDVGLLFTVKDDNEMDAVPTTANRRYVGYFALDFKTGELLFDLRNPVSVENET